MKKESKTNILFGLIGPTASGKTELSKHIVKKHDFLYIPSITTRPPREGNLIEYKHIDIETFKRHIENNELLEYTIFADHYYGKLKEDVMRHHEKGHSVYTLTPDKVRILKENHKHAKILCIIPEDPILKTVEKRLKKRNLNKNELIRRLKTVGEDLMLIENLKKENLIDHFVITFEDRSHAISEINKIVNRYKKHR